MSKKEEVTLYKVKNVIERIDIDERGRFYRAVEVIAETKSGIEFSLLVPKAEFTKTKAADRLEKEAAELEAVRSLAK
jgi:hypothetical protein